MRLLHKPGIPMYVSQTLRQGSAEFSSGGVGSLQCTWQHLDAPVVDISDARLPLREERRNSQCHGGVRNVVAVVINALQLLAWRACTPNVPHNMVTHKCTNRRATSYARSEAKGLDLKGYIFSQETLELMQKMHCGRANRWGVLHQVFGGYL